VIFFFDAIIPVGIISGLEYIPLFLIAMWYRKPYQVLFTAALCSLYVGLGYLLLPSTAKTLVSAAYRLIGCAGVWAAAIVLLRRLRLGNELEKLAKFPIENPNPVLRLTPDGQLQYANDRARSIFSLDGLDGPLPDNIRTGLSTVNRTGRSTEVEISADGRVYSLLLAPIDSNRYVYAYGRDITSQRKLENILRKESLTDGLTQIANRRKLDAALAAEWGRAMRYGNPVSALMIDIDFFKFYNDTYGHQAGDSVLIDVARELSESVNRPGDLATRYGGEEFVVLLPGVDTDRAVRFAETLRTRVEALGIEHSRSKAAPVVTVSIGVASRVPRKEISPQSLIKAADKALYEAKEAGRNRIRVLAVDADMKEQLR
jgi:diguanylate cyclase (GGDEF)-like protein